MHRANHPNTEHYVADVFEVDPIHATQGQPVGILWASPDCRHHSKAKGGKPRNRKIRGLAWVIIRWAYQTSPRLIFLENVEEFADWSPLDDEGKPACRPEVRRGQQYTRYGHAKAAVDEGRLVGQQSPYEKPAASRYECDLYQTAF